MTDLILDPPSKDERLVQNTLTLRPSDWDLLEQLGKDRGTNKSEAARAILDAYRRSAAKRRP